MRFGALPALVVLGASIVVASPIRVIVTEVSSTGVRYGHATADIAPVFASNPIELLNAPAVNNDALPTHRRPGCQGMRSKALEASNALRQWLGLEPIKPNQGGPRIHHAHHMSGEGPVVVKFSDKTGTGADIPVLPFVGTPVRPAFVPESEDRRTGPRPMWVHRHQHFRGSFLRRVHHALMSLGPWEGRAVAFVLGCGIGVLLRMVWVIALVTARAIRGQREDEHEYDVVFDEAEAEMLVPPPQYTIIEGTEAVPVPVDEKADKN